MPRDYTNVEVRQILVGLGYLPTSAELTVFPFTTDNNPLTDSPTTKAIRSFQEQYKLLVDGIYGPQTRTKLQQVMKILQDQLNIVVQTGIPENQPFYGRQTFDAVNVFLFQIRLRRHPDGIASYDLRVELNKRANLPLRLTEVGKPNYNPQKFPYQNQALNWLQGLLNSGSYPGILAEFARQWRNQETADNKPIKLTDVAIYLDGKKYPHQNQALDWLQSQLTKEDLADFTKRWRNL